MPLFVVIFASCLFYRLPSATFVLLIDVNRKRTLYEQADNEILMSSYGKSIVNRNIDCLYKKT